jgi:hypothetical protein
MVAAVTGFPARSRRRPHGGPTPSRRYERRRPEKTPLHKIVSENLESWLAWRESAERPVPGYVEEELRGYLECGLLCFGFARAVCMTCRTGFVVAFSCKGRGVCPSCNGRHMSQTAAHLVDHVIPPVPVRQWVISVPKRLRGMLADRPAAVAALTKIFLAEIERLLLSAAGRTPDADMPKAARPRLGGISFLHRFGSALNHHVHLHACVTDGVFVPAAADAGCDAPPAFLPARPITQADLAAPTERVRRRLIRWAATGGHGSDGHATEGCCDANHATQKPRSHDTSRIAWAKLMARVGEEFPLECPNCGGDIRLRGDRRQEPAHFEPEVRKRKKARMASPA